MSVRIRLGVVAISSLVAVLFPTPGWCWGREGHRAVCEIAFRELGPRARRVVQDLIRQDARYRTFREACTWPDTDGTLQDRLRPEHYVNVPRDWFEIPDRCCPLAARCLFTALERDAASLGSGDAGSERRLIALRSLGHWVADLHQPLHVAYRSDRGGNDLGVGGEPPCAPNLHAVWDTCLPRYLAERLGSSHPMRLGELLHSRIDPEERSAWLEERDFAAWATESLRLARDPTLGYCELRETTGTCAEPGRGPEVDAGYLSRHAAEVERRIQQAGVRLAALLEELLSAADPP